MSMWNSKIEFEIDINNDELSKTIWEHRREIKSEEGVFYTIKLANFHSFTIIFTSFFHFQSEASIKFFKII
jgi:hypothetical protein